MYGPGLAAAHESSCVGCGHRDLIPLADTRVEECPWRLVWRCDACGDWSSKPIPTGLVAPILESFDTVGGSVISLREVEDLEVASLTDLMHAMTDELLESP